MGFMDYVTCPTVTGVAVVIFVMLWWKQRKAKTLGLDERTTKMLTASEAVEKECAAIVRALTSAPVVSDESDVRSAVYCNFSK